jgi:tetratricopeptide (TPR) repeat protein
LPDGALLVARTNTVRGDATLAAQTHAQLLLGAERLEAAVLGLAMATKFPQLMKLDVALAEAEEVRREQPTNARVLAAMADAVASGSPPDFALASDLYRRAARLDPQSSLTLIAAVYAAGQTNDSSALALLADELLLAFPTDASAMRVVIGALAQAGNARGAADVAVRLAGTTRLAGDIALAARAMAGVNEHAEAERILDRALALRPDLVQCAEVRAALAARGVPESPTESAQRAPVEIRAVALALAADDLSGLRAALIDWPTSSLSPMSRVMVVDLLRDAALRQGQCSDASIDAIRKLEGDTVARAVFLARATFLRALDSSDTTAARALADTLVNDWCAWLAAIRTAQRAGMTQSSADVARRAFAALPDEPRLLRDGLDALLADHVGDALNDARKVIERMRAKHAENRSFVEAAALLAIAQGDGAKARAELASMRTRAADDDALRSLDMCALALTGSTDLAASTLSSPMLLSITNMMSLAQARSFVDALMTQASTEVTALAALHADLALRQPLDARAASDAAMAATAACAAIARATDPLATASASMRAACASGDDRERSHRLDRAASRRSGRAAAFGLHRARSWHRGSIDGLGGSGRRSARAARAKSSRCPRPCAHSAITNVELGRRRSH